MQSVGQVNLKNGGGFVCNLGFQYIDPNTGQLQVTKFSSDILLGQSNTQNPGDLGVPNGATFFVYVNVVWGTNNLAKQGFIYQSGSPVTANYVITGTTLDNTLGLVSVS